ncbi:Polyferredoxin [Candidatus Terasakiella magnetica]|nr:Polyferredoxin [Candidatus Terasakiella magnetica]
MMAATSSPLPRSRLARLGDGMARHAGAIQVMQWGMVVVYLALVSIPAFLPVPDDSRHIWDDLVLFAQFAFWGVWWPFVMVSMLVMGRAWCGVFCPEGTMTEWASRHGLGRAIPAWLRWRGWPFVAFVCTTVYGQMITVYEYPKAALLILGASTVMALAVGWIYGRGHRVWCRYLCPASGVFSLLSRLAPLHFQVDAQAWRAAPRQHAVQCAPLVDVRSQTGGGGCQMCGRCSGHRDAVTLAPRLPGIEVTHLPQREVSPWDIVLLLFGMMGVATGAFQWSGSPLFVALKQGVATVLIEHGIIAPMTTSLPWWILTNSDETGEVFSLLDGACLLAYMGGSALAFGLVGLGGLALAARLGGDVKALWRLGYGLIPQAAVGLVVGLSSMTLTQLGTEGIIFAWVPEARAALLALGMVWSGVLLWSLLPPRRRPLAWLAAMAGVLFHATAWALFFF